MTQSIETTATEVVAPVAVKAPSKKSQAVTIFATKMAERAQGRYGSNKEFRAATLVAIETELGVSRASASTMYNSAAKEATAADATLVLGRDPKKVKAPSTGKRGRPTGSRNKTKVEAAAEIPASAEGMLVVNTPDAETEAAPAEATA
jgi:hypothetical protein